MTTQCLCQICSCGRHRCPHSPPPTVIPRTSSSDLECVLSEYRDSFHYHGGTCVRKSKKIKHDYKPSQGDMATTTTSRSDYVPHKMPTRTPKAAKTYVEPAGTMLLKSIYTKDFVSYPVQRNIVKKTEKYDAPTAKMDFQSVYKEVYQCWDVVRPEPFHTSDNLTVSTDKFKATSTCQDDFCPKTAEVRESFKPTQKVHKPQTFEGTTNNRLVYVAHPLPRRTPKQKTPYVPNSAPFDGVSIHRQDYKGSRGDAVKSYKPKSAWEASVIPFDDSSEYQGRYKAWPVQPPFQRKSEGQTLQGGTMELTSTVREDYVGQHGPPAVSARPPIKAWCKGKPFEDCSTTKEDYPAWRTKRPSRIVRGEQMSPPSGPFETTTTSRSEYTVKNVPKTASYKPVQRAMSPRTMDDDSIYRTTFVNKEVRRCPASFTEPPGFQYKSMGRGGHILFRTASASGERSVARPSTATPGSTSVKTCRPVKSAVLRRGNRVH